MARIVDFRSVLAVRDLQVSTRFYTDVLGFRRDPIEASGWSFLSRDSFKVMLGECRDDVPASETGSHSYFVHVLVDGVDALHEELSSRGAEVISPLTDTPWGLREFVIRTPDGHRLVFGEPVPDADAEE
jgi:uncharacterized glyoxalase superfamily protein PhnB